MLTTGFSGVQGPQPSERVQNERQALALGADPTAESRHREHFHEEPFSCLTSNTTRFGSATNTVAEAAGVRFREKFIFSQDATSTATGGSPLFHMHISGNKLDL